MGAAEAPTKLVTAGFSPFLISLGMVSGVFVARWTLPAALKGTSYVISDFRGKAHLMVWALLAGVCWAVANTLTVFAIRNVGLSIAFPLWNTNSLVGLFWGWLLFNELRGAGAKDWAKVIGGALAIVVGACVIAYATSQQQAAASERAALGILAALGAGLLWGTMYIPYRKAYISGMNPLSFVTVFTVGELGLCSRCRSPSMAASTTLRWNFACPSGHVLVISRRILLGSGRPVPAICGQIHWHRRGIPLSNTNQIWGLLWGALVFGELANRTAARGRW